MFKLGLEFDIAESVARFPARWSASMSWELMVDITGLARSLSEPALLGLLLDKLDCPLDFFFLKILINDLKNF